ncbi:hypothetical protein [Oceanobacillus massiliensis]|nr:hypothetical protein [Oceanobacillus massiliensis]
MLLESGVSLIYVSNRLGHKSIKQRRTLIWILLKK